MKKPQLVPTLLGASGTPVSLVIASLGNPGRQYAKTRHNAGHIVLQKVRDHLSLGSSYRTVTIPGGVATTWDSFPGLVLMESGSFMNVSDKSIGQMLNWHRKNCYQGNDRKLMIMHDELDMPLGKVAYKQPSKAHNGHNGLRNIPSKFADPYSRIRIGIGRPESKDSDHVARYVLGKFRPEEMNVIDTVAVPETVRLIEEIIQSGILDAD